MSSDTSEKKEEGSAHRNNMPSKIKLDCKTIRKIQPNGDKIDVKIWNDVKYLVLFFGHFRSGTTLIGSLLDAHPNIVMSNEYGPLNRWENWSSKQKTRDYFFQQLYSKSYADSKGPGTRSPWRHCYHDHYAYAIPDQWQGKFDKTIKVKNYEN